MKAEKEKLEKVQRRAVNMVAGLKGKTYQDKLKEVGLTTVEERRDRGDTPPGWWRGTVSMKTEETSSASQRVPARWNSLPESTRQQATVLGFKAAYYGTILRTTGQQ